MWCDWSKRQQVSRQACCSSRQFVNSLGTFGYTYGPICEFRARSTGFPTFSNKASKLWALIAASNSSCRHAEATDRVPAACSRRAITTSQGSARLSRRRSD